jgi:sugar O-acyltransferase (sialic acid O-acetyltransferase NeuD family)
VRQALILGAGGHCRVVASILKDCDDHEILGIIDLCDPKSGEQIMDLPVIGSAACLEAYLGYKNLDVYLAIGDNAIRRLWWQKVRSLDISMPNLISPSAIVNCYSIMGESNIICAKALVGPEAKIGINNLINTGAVVEHEVLIGDHCHLAASSTIAGRSRVGDECLIGASATVINGISVEERTIIGAGATLISNINEPGGVYVGTPAKRKSQ